MLAIVVDAPGVGDSAVGVGVIAIGAPFSVIFYGKLVVLRDALDDVI
jgi:hypothetical protein